MDERQERVVDVSAPRAPTRWDERPSAPIVADRPERSGAYLAVVVAIVVPALVIITAVRAAVFGEVARAVLPNQRVELEEPPPPDPVTQVAGPSIPAVPERPEEGSDRGPSIPSLVERDVVVTAPTASGAPSSSIAAAPAPLPAVVAAPPATATVPPPTTSVPTTDEPTITTTTATTAAPTTSTSVPPGDPVAFVQRVDIGELGDTFVRYRFAVDRTSAYTAVLQRDGVVESSTVGTATAGEQVNARFDGLVPGTDYSVKVILDGPPESASVAVAFRTSGVTLAEVITPVEVLDLRIASLGATRVELHYDSNVCANGSFTIVDDAGTLIGSNQGQAVGCTTRHLAIPGFWTPALEPGASYTITVQLEANGQGRGEGNTATASLTFTTADRG